MHHVAVLALLGAGCSVVLPFDFDGGAADLQPGLSSLGGPCARDQDCRQYGGLQPTVCITQLGTQSFPGGYCSRTCTLAVGCPEYPGAACGPVSATGGICVPRCNPGQGQTCPRPDYPCCNSMGTTTRDGVCAPQGSAACR